MAAPNLPVNVDTTYPDSGTDPSVAVHQQHHDKAHTVVNMFDMVAPTVAGQLPIWDTVSGSYKAGALPLATAAGLLSATDNAKYLTGALYGVASGLATLDSGGSVAQQPASHSHPATPTIVRPDDVSSTLRSLLKFAGAVTVADDSAGARTVVTVTQAVVNDIVLASDYTCPANSVTMLSLPGMSQAVNAGETWIFDGVTFVLGDATADISLDATCPAGTVRGIWSGIATGATVTTGAHRTESQVISGGGNGFAALTPVVVAIRHTIRFACTTTGTFQFRAAQNTAVAAVSTVVQAGSWTTAARII